MAYPISKAALDAVFFRLTANNEGFNETYNALASSYGVPANMSIVFSPTPPAPSPNFSRGNVSPLDIVETSAVKFPYVTLFVDRIFNENTQKFHQFSGVVSVGLAVLLSWPEGRVLPDFESQAACVEETVVTIMNRARNAHPGDQDWGDLEGSGADIVYNGELEGTRSRVERGNQFWSQLLLFRMTFEVHSRGEV